MRWLPEPDLQPNKPGNKAAIDLESGEAPETSSPTFPVAPSRPRILLADDNADMREYIRRLLGQSYEIRAVTDGVAALQALRECAPDLVLTDIMMPGLDGLELLREMRAAERLRTVPVILLSARAGEEARIEGMQAGADDYLVKPFSARELLARDRVLNIDDANIPLPHMQRVADVEKLFLPVQFEFVQSFGSRLSAKTVELLAVDADDVAQVAIPAENRAKDVVEIGEL